MIGAWLLPVVSAGLLGSVHCIGMCGALVAVASDGAVGLKQRAGAQAVYQAGRLVSYAALGAAAGTLGRALDLAGQAAGLGQAAAIVAGSSMALWGLLAMLRAAGVPARLPRWRLLPAPLGRWLAGVQGRPPLARAALLGGASALLPCGFLYAFALAGAATGSALGGALVMAALWLGNLPALLGFGLALGGVLGRVRRHLPLLSAASIFALGVLTLSSRVNLPAFALGAASAASATASAASGPAAMPADCPCHRKRH